MDGKSQRSRSGQNMFTQANTQTPFTKSRVDLESLFAPLGGGGGSAGRDGQEGLRFGMPADPLMDEVLRFAPAMPVGLEARLHQLVDHLMDDPTVV